MNTLSFEDAKKAWFLEHYGVTDIFPHERSLTEKDRDTVFELFNLGDNPVEYYMNHVILLCKPNDARCSATVVRQIYSTDNSEFRIRVYKQQEYDGSKFSDPISLCVSEAKSKFNANDLRELFKTSGVVIGRTFYQMSRDLECVNVDEYAEVGSVRETLWIVPSDNSSAFDTHLPRGCPQNIIIESENVLIGVKYQDGTVKSELLYMTR